MSDQRSELEKQTGFEGKGDLYVYLLFAAIIASVVSIVLFVLCLRRMKALYSGTLFPGRFMKKDVVTEGAEKGQTCRTVEFPAPFSLHKMKRRMEGGRVVNEEFTLYCSPCTCCTGDTVIEFQDHLELLSRPACIAGLLHLLWFIGFGGISILFFVVSTLPGKEAAGAIFAAACLVGAVPWWAFRCCPNPKWPENLVDEKSTSRPTSGSLLGNNVPDSTSSAPVSPAKQEPPKEEKSWPACGRCGKPASLVWGCECTEVLYCSRECKTEHAPVHANECKSQGGKGVKGGLAMQSITVSVDQLPPGPVAHQDSLGMAPAPYIGVGSADTVRPSVAVRF